MLLIGLLDLAVYFTADSQSHEQRDKMDEEHPRIMSLHLSRAAAILLCIVTELPAHFKFEDEGAYTNERICEMWRVLMPAFDVEELYHKRYETLMRTREWSSMNDCGLRSCQLDPHHGHFR